MYDNSLNNLLYNNIYNLSHSFKITWAVLFAKRRFTLGLHKMSPLCDWYWNSIFFIIIFTSVDVHTYPCTWHHLRTSAHEKPRRWSDNSRLSQSTSALVTKIDRTCTSTNLWLHFCGGAVLSSIMWCRQSTIVWRLASRNDCSAMLGLYYTCIGAVSRARARN